MLPQDTTSLEAFSFGAYMRRRKAILILLRRGS